MTGWVVLTLLFAALVLLNLWGYLGRDSKPGALNNELDVRLRTIVASKSLGESTKNPEIKKSIDTQLEDLVAEVVGKKGSDRNAALFYAAARTEQGKAVTLDDVALLRKGDEASKAVAELYTNLKLDEKTLVIVAAVPGMGKTTFAINMIENAMLKNGIDGPAVVFSMEMGDTDLAERMISSVGSVYQGNMRTSKMAEDDWKKVSAAVTKMHNWPMYIDETPTMNIMQMRAKLRRISRNHEGKVGVVLVNYLQLMQAVEKTSDRQREVAEIAVGLKSLSKEFNCPVVALSQLSRKVSDRPNKRPMMSDLRESGYIEQAADLIMFIYRDEIYNIDSKDKGLAEIIIDKQRKGKTGVKVVMRFDGGRSRFVDDMQQQDWQS